MKPDRLMEQVTGILLRAEVPFQFHEDGQEIGIGTDETVVFIRPVEHGGNRFLHVAADLAVGIEITPEVAAGIYVWLNQRNSEAPLARFVLREAPKQEAEVQRAWVSAEWELAAKDLDASQLLLTIEVLVERAESWAAPLTQLFGGQTPADIRVECEEINRIDGEELSD